MKGIFSEQQGTGYPVILLHGFPMNHVVWNTFATKLASNLKVYTPDLPGFGQSDALPAGFSIDQIAEKILAWIDSLGLNNSVVIGHSLGGYITLAMAEKRPDLFAGFGLFHSTALADSIEKKDSRTKVVEFVKKNGATSFTANFIQPLFAEPTHPAVPLVREIAIQSSAESVIGYTKAMRDRPNREHVLETFSGPILLMAGEKDQGIPAESLRQQSLLCQFPFFHLLTGSAHMGMYEQEAAAIEIVKSFVDQCK